MSAEEVLRVENLHKYFGALEVLKGIDLTVHKGETIVIIGSSGSGKSTLLRCINFLEMPTEGYIYMDGQRVGRAREDGDGRQTMHYPERDLHVVRAKVGMVFQHFNLFPHMTVLDNVTLAPLKVLNLPPDEARERAKANLEKVGIADKADQYPSRLSGGQQQRVAIARALAMVPTIMMFDEATSALDPELVGEVLRTIRELSNEGMTMLVVTHEIGFAYAVADRLIFIHEGKIHEQGTPDEVLIHPQRQRTRDFLREFTLFRLPEPSA